VSEISLSYFQYFGRGNFNGQLFLVGGAHFLWAQGDVLPIPPKISHWKISETNIPPTFIKKGWPKFSSVVAIKTMLRFCTL
jgi:hypothetical protein